jgi:hypothetical protein
MTATYIWATAKAHEVMDDYLKFQFFEHPAIAAVLARHLAATAVLPNENVANKLQAIDNRVLKLTAKVDSIESKFNNNKQVHIADPPRSDSPAPTRPNPKNGLQEGNNSGLPSHPFLSWELSRQLCLLSISLLRKKRGLPLYPLPPWELRLQLFYPVSNRGQLFRPLNLANLVIRGRPTKVTMYQVLFKLLHEYLGGRFAELLHPGAQGQGF